MKKSVMLAAVIILVLSTIVSAQYSPEEKAADKTPPVIDSMHIEETARYVIELNWWVYDNVQLSRYEIYKDGALIKTKPIGGIRQSSKFRDGQAWDDPVYTFKVYDVAGNSAEQNVSLDKEEETKEILAEIEEAMPIETFKEEPEKEPAVAAEPAPEVPAAEIPEETEEKAPVIEEPASLQNSLLAAVLVLIVLAVFWKLLTLQPKKEMSHKHRRYQEIGLHDYLHKRKKR